MQFPVLDVKILFINTINEKLYKNKIVRHIYILVVIRLCFGLNFSLYYLASTPIQRFPSVLVSATKAKVDLTRSFLEITVIVTRASSKAIP